MSGRYNSSANGVRDAAEVIDDICEVAARWPEKAREVGVPEKMIKEIEGNMVKLCRS